MSDELTTEQSKLAITAGREKEKNALYKYKAFISVSNTSRNNNKKTQSFDVSVKINDTMKIM